MNIRWSSFCDTPAGASFCLLNHVMYPFFRFPHSAHWFYNNILQKDEKTCKCRKFGVLGFSFFYRTLTVLKLRRYGSTNQKTRFSYFIAFIAFLRYMRIFADFSRTNPNSLRKSVQSVFYSFIKRHKSHDFAVHLFVV